MLPHAKQSALKASRVFKKFLSSYCGVVLAQNEDVDSEFFKLPVMSHDACTALLTFCLTFFISFFIITNYSLMLQDGTI